MRYHLLGFVPLLAMTHNALAQPVATPSIAQPTACVSSQFSASGDQHWKTITLQLTNKCSTAVDFQNASVTFRNSSSLNSTFWGSFDPLPYPDNAMNITSQPQADGKFLSTFTLHFPSWQGATTKLPAGRSIIINYGVTTDTHIEGSVNVYSGTAAETGSLVLNNATTKPAQVSQTYALVHVSANGQLINDIQVPWRASVTVPGLATGNYTLSADSVSDSQGNTYTGTTVPVSVTVTAGQQANSTVSYTQVQQTGKVTINVQSLPAELSGYSNIPVVTLTNQSGSSVTKNAPWNSATVVSPLKTGDTWQFSTPPVSYSGYNCAPTFAPATLVSGDSAPSTTLTYKCMQMAQDTVTLNVKGAPATLSSLKVTLKPNNGAAATIATVTLNNGSGTNTALLTDGLIYTVSADPVSGYSASFAPQPLVATANGVETITLTSDASSTPVAANGQLTVCGTQLCNKQGNPIQLKGMSTHGLQWYGEETCITPTALDFISNNMKSNVIRLAMYVQEGGYETNPVKYTQEVNDLINKAYARGIYVIVDWHILNPGDPNYNLARAKTFFTDVIKANPGKNNLIYEIANEPNGVSWAAIKSYADQIIPVIRALDPAAPIIVGTRGWSSLGVSDGSTYQEIVNNPVAFSNVMYSFHFYAASHRDEYLNALDSASKVLPVFVTEFGTQTYSGDGDNDFTMSDRYMQLMATKKIGWVNWNFADDFRSGSIWKTGTCSSGAWVDGNLKASGVYIKSKILNP